MFATGVTVDLAEWIFLLFMKYPVHFLRYQPINFCYIFSSFRYQNNYNWVLCNDSFSSWHILYIFWTDSKMKSFRFFMKHPVNFSDTKEITVEPGETTPLPINYVWARIFAKPCMTGKVTWNMSEKPINWYHIMTKEDNFFEVYQSKHGWNRYADPFR